MLGTVQLLPAELIALDLVEVHSTPALGNYLRATAEYVVFRFPISWKAKLVQRSIEAGTTLLRVAGFRREVS